MATRRTNSKEARARAKRRRAVQTKIDTLRDRQDDTKGEIAKLRAELRSI